jgi:hypothetical protein
MPKQAERLITGVNVREYFQDMLAGTVTRQSVPVQEETVVYLANLLANFVRAEQLYERTPDGVFIRPLADLYGDAVNARSGDEAFRAMQRLGDLSLFVSGLFSRSLGRSLVDVLAEVGETGGLQTGNDILRLYEIWLATGSPSAAARLRQLGIEPVRSQRRTH